jgi:hypothetical protein
MIQENKEKEENGAFWWKEVKAAEANPSLVRLPSSEAELWETQPYREPTRSPARWGGQIEILTSLVFIISHGA